MRACIPTMGIIRARIIDRTGRTGRIIGPTDLIIVPTTSLATATTTIITDTIAGIMTITITAAGAQDWQPG